MTRTVTVTQSQFRMLWTLVHLGIPSLQKASKRTAADMRLEGDILTALEAVSLTWQDALKQGCVPDELKPFIADKQVPMLPTGDPLRVLGQSQAELTFDVPALDRLKAICTEGAPWVPVSETRLAVETLDLLTLAMGAA